jgi:glycosyltransferase involved in cell wall biosynthesis
MNVLPVSVVIPAYRAANTIGRAVDSALSQTKLPLEIVIVDDGSPDDLPAALAKYGDRVTVVRQANQGAASARNRGIEQARGEFLAFLDADDYWEPVKLERQWEIIQSHSEVGLVAGQFYDQEPGQPRMAPPTVSGGIFNQVLKVTGPDAFAVAARIWTGTVIVRRRVLGDERFVSGLEPAEDRDLWVRLVAANPVYLLSEPLATAVWEPGSISRTSIDIDCANMLRVVRRHEALLGRKGLRQWETITLRRWAANHLAQGRPRSALPLAWRRLQRQPFSREGWWILLKCATLAVLK